MQKKNEWMGRKLGREQGMERRVSWQKFSWMGSGSAAARILTRKESFCLTEGGNQRIHEKFMWYLLFTGTPNSNANNTLKGFLFLITCPSVHMCFHMSIGTQRGQKMTLDPLEVELQGLWICPLWVLRTEFVSFQEQEMFLVTGLAPCPANPVCHWGCFYTLHRVTTEEMIQ